MLYVDSLGQYAVRRIKNHEMEVPTTIHIDIYMDPYGSMYLLTKNSYKTDTREILQTNDKGE